MNKQKTLIFSLSAMLFLAASFIVYSWTEPTTMPATYNTPLNTGTTAQTKLGEIGATIFRDAVAPNYYVDPSGNSFLSGNVSAADPVANEHLATKGYIDSLFGNMEQETSVSNLIYITGQNPECPSDSITVMRKWNEVSCKNPYEYPSCPTTGCTTSANWVSGVTAPTCAYVVNGYASCVQSVLNCVANSWTEAICAKTGTPLASSQHTEEQCHTWNGEVVTVEGNVKICKLNSATCPGSWNQYKNWSTTTSNPSAFPEDPINGTYYYTGSHTWSNTAIESFGCRKCPGSGTWQGYSFCGTGSSGSCPSTMYYTYASVIEIGCY